MGAHASASILESFKPLKNTNPGANNTNAVIAHAPTNSSHIISKTFQRAQISRRLDYHHAHIQAPTYSLDKA